MKTTVKWLGLLAVSALLASCVTVKAVMPVYDVDELGNRRIVDYKSVDTSREALWRDVEVARIQNQKPVAVVRSFDRNGGS